MFVCIHVSLYVSSSLHLLRFGQLLCCADKRIVNIMKVHVHRKNNMQVELLCFREKILTLFTFTFAKRGFQYNIAHQTQL